jgi:hypothetical protein
MGVPLYFRNKKMTHCTGTPAEQLLESYLQGTLSEAEARGFEEHYFDCPVCLAQAEALQSVAMKLKGLPMPPEKKPIPWPRRAGLWGAIAATLVVGFIGIRAGRMALRSGDGFSLGGNQTKPIPKAGEELIAALQDGDRKLALGKNGQLHGADGLPPEAQEGIKSALATGRLEANLPPEFRAAHEKTMLGSSSGTPPFRVLSPVLSIVIDDRPRFVWESMPAATGYRVRIYTDTYRKVAESPLLKATEWQSAVPMPRGQRYIWTVTAESPSGEVRVPAPPQPEAAFEILDAKSAQGLEEAARRCGQDHLTLALLYAHAGAIDAARAELDHLAAQNPGNPLFTQLRASLNQDVPSPTRTKAAQ